MSNKCTTLFVITLLLFSMLAYAARPHPAFPQSSAVDSRHDERVEAERVEVGDSESCEGTNQEECLMRRTLVAHTDYIYSQEQNN